MKIKSIALGSLLMAISATSTVANAQARTPSFTLAMANGATCPLSGVQLLYLDPIGMSCVLAGDSNPVWLQYVTAQFNPKEYSLAARASVVVKDSTGLPSPPMEIPIPDSFRAVLAGTTSVAGSGGGRGNRSSGQSSSSNGLNQAVLDDLVPFFASDDSAMVRLPPAVSGGVPVDPTGHIYCVVKTKTKSNQSNDRSSGHAGEKLEVYDSVSAQNVRILLQGGDGKGEMVFTPLAMGAMKLTKADAGRALDGGMNAKKIRDWIKSSYDNRSAAFDPSLTNVLQFDISSTEADKLSSQFQPGQSMRIKVKFPWLCDADCAMTQPLSTSWIEKISPTVCRVSIEVKPEACRLLPTVNK